MQEALERLNERRARALLADFLGTVGEIAEDMDSSLKASAKVTVGTTLATAELVAAMILAHERLHLARAEAIGLLTTFR